MSSLDKHPIKVGLLFSQSGVTAVVEQTQFNAAQLAVAEINRSGGVLGRPLEIVSYDPASNPKSFAAHAETLLVDDDVQVIFGCYMSSTRKAVLPIIERHQGLLFYPTLYEGFEFSPNCVYSGAAPNQNIIGLAQYLMQNYGHRFYLVGSNYVYPYETNRILTDFIVSSGGRIIEERYVPLTSPEEHIRGVVEDIKKNDCPVIISTVVGDGTTSLYREYRRAGFNVDDMPIGSPTTGEPEIAAMGSDLAEGHITSAPYFQSVDTAENKRFTAAYAERFGTDAAISACTEAAYIQVHLFAKAVAQAGLTTPDAVKRALPDCSFLAPQGPVRIDAENNHTYLWPRIGRANAEGQFDIKQESTSPVKPDPYLVNPPDEQWDLRSLSA